MIGEREIAVKALMEITVDGAYSNLALRRVLAAHPDLSRVQKAFVTELVTGCVRNLIHIDYLIDKISSTATTKMKPSILCILRISVYQMLYMNKTPAFAICNEAVNLAKRIGPTKLAGFVNGVLRNIHRNLFDLLNIDGDVAEQLSIKYSCARWIVEHFIDELGLEVAVATIEAAQIPPRITLCVNTNRISKTELKDLLTHEGLDVCDGNLVECCLSVSKTSDITALQSFKKGFFHIIDEAAVLAVKCAMPISGRVIDLCAAPGGKSFAVASLTSADSILARDIYPHKLDLIRNGAKRLGHDHIKISHGDATLIDASLRQTADLLIVDAPCSGLGTLGKRPDIKLERRKSKDDLAQLVNLQRQILSASWDYVKPGGKLLYATCTISDTENINNRNWLLDNFPFKPVDFSYHMPDFAGFKTACEGYIQVMPQDYNTDGFFVAVFERV